MCVCIFSPICFGVAKLVIIINKKIYPNWLLTKYEKYILKKESKNSFIFWLPAGNEYRNLAINNNNNNNNNFLKFGKLGPFFHKKILHICQKSCFPVPKKMHKFWWDLQQNHWGSEFSFFGCMHDYYYYYYYYFCSSHHVNPISMRIIKVPCSIKEKGFLNFLDEPCSLISIIIHKQYPCGAIHEPLKMISKLIMQTKQNKTQQIKNSEQFVGEIHGWLGNDLYIMKKRFMCLWIFDTLKKRLKVFNPLNLF